MTTDATVFVVDDEPMVRKAVARLLRAEGMRVMEYDSAQAFLDRYDGSAPGCLLLDLAMPGINGLELQERLHAKEIRIPIVFLTGRADVPMSVRAMKDGAVDLLVKPCDDRVLIAAVRGALERDASMRRERSSLADAERCLHTLTPREREVMGMVVAGRLNKQAAAELGVAEKTVKVHRGRVMAKMRVGSLADLVRVAERLGVGTGVGDGGGSPDVL